METKSFEASVGPSSFTPPAKVMPYHIWHPKDWDIDPPVWPLIGLGFERMLGPSIERRGQKQDVCLDQFFCHRNRCSPTMGLISLVRSYEVHNMSLRYMLMCVCVNTSVFKICFIFYSWNLILAQKCTFICLCIWPWKDLYILETATNWFCWKVRLWADTRPHFLWGQIKLSLLLLFELQVHTPTLNVTLQFTEKQSQESSMMQHAV